MIVAAASLLLLGAVQPGATSCDRLRSEADRLQAQMDGMITETVDAELASMRGRRQMRAQQRATDLASNVPVVGSFIADAVTAAAEARQARLDARSDETSERMVEAGPELGRRVADLEMAYEMQCWRPAARQGGQP